MPFAACSRCRAKAIVARPAGVALITVLLIVFLASMTAVSLAMVQQIAIRRSTLLQHQQQARLYVLGAEQWAGLVLLRDRKANTTDHLGELWANLPTSLPVENGVVSGKIRDLQGCFNLNSLWRPGAKSAPTAPAPLPEGGKIPKASEKKPAPPVPEAPDPAADTAPPGSGKGGIHPGQLKVLQRLLTGLDLKPELAQAVVDWIDPDQDALFPDGAEDSDYTVLDPPYRAANRPFVSVSELRQVKGIQREIYDALAPWVCALPSGVALNINTASARVLAALDEQVEVADLERVLKERPVEGYKNVDELLNAAKVTVEASTKALLGVSSQYFLLQAEARVGDGRAMLYSTLFRDENGVRVLQRSFGNQD